jgi:CSLREA domain-containing protein
MLRLGAFLTAFLTVAAIFGFLALSDEPATAGADFVVTKQNDGNDGVCDNDCTLREAIQNANTDPGPDVISVPTGTYVLTVPGDGEQDALTGDLDITSDITIQGVGLVTIDGNDHDHVFEILPGATLVTIAGVNITNSESDTINGGAVLIATAASVQLQNCSVTDSVVTDFGAGIAVFGGGNLQLNNCTLDNNHALGNGPQQGGNLYVSQSSVATLTNCTVSGGEAAFGAGAYVAPGGILTVSACTFLFNDAGQDGGGFYNEGQMFLTNVTTHENHAGNRGGGTFTTGATAISNISNSTLGFDTGESAGVHVLDGATVNLHSTILRRTADPNCGGEPLNSEGYNLANDATCNLDGVGDIEGADPLLQPLANNGGLTQTYLLGAGSPAINAGSPACPPPAQDQRGVNRPVGPRCDIGAVEGSSPAPSVTLPPTGGATNTPPPTNTPAPTNPPGGDEIEWGDMDCDGDVDAVDALIILLGIEDLDPDQDEPCPEVGEEVTLAN